MNNNHPTTMSYVPPHMRSTIERSTVQKKKNEPPKKKAYIEEFPSLNKESKSTLNYKETPNSKPVPPKPTLATLFKNSLNRKQKKRQPKIKKGWILLTFNGVIDSLSPEERKHEDASHYERMNKMRLENMTREMERRDLDRQENDHTYLWEWEMTRAEFDKPEYEENDSEYFTESDSEMYDEYGEDDELYYEN